MIRRIREIKAVGLRNWLWFVVWLERDEFDTSLYSTPFVAESHRDKKIRIDKLVRDRQRAHEISIKLDEVRNARK